MIHASEGRAVCWSKQRGGGRAFTDTRGSLSDGWSSRLSREHPRRATWATRWPFGVSGADTGRPRPIRQPGRRLAAARFDI